jgi:hypothetical protein
VSDIPKHLDAGSDGSQEVSSKELNHELQIPIDGLPITKVVQGLAASKSRSMGGEVAANLIAGSFNQISQELYETKKELKVTRSKLDEKIENLSDCKQRVAVLEERVRAALRNRNLRNFSIFAGTSLIAIALQLENMSVSSYIIGLLGCLFIVFGWFSTDGEVKK